MKVFLTYFAGSCRGIQAEPGVQSRYPVRTQVFIVVRAVFTPKRSRTHGLKMTSLIDRIVKTIIQKGPNFI